MVDIIIARDINNRLYISSILIIAILLVYPAYALEGFIEQTSPASTTTTTIGNECLQRGWACKESCDKEIEYGGYGRLGCGFGEECCKPKTTNAVNNQDRPAQINAKADKVLNCKCPDVNNDGIIDIKDLSTVAKHKGEKNEEFNLDSGNDIVDENDLRCVSERVGEDTNKIDRCNQGSLIISNTQITNSEGVPLDLNSPILKGTILYFTALIQDPSDIGIVNQAAKVESYLNNNKIEEFTSGLGDISNEYNAKIAIFQFSISIENMLNPEEDGISKNNIIRIILTVKSNDGSETKTEKEFSLDFIQLSHSTEHCKELIPEHNNLDENRANIVFIGFGFDVDPKNEKNHGEIVKSIAEFIIDYDGDNYGLLSVEPFKSNKDKFNFWYVDKVSPIDSKWCDLPPNERSSINKRGNCYDYELLTLNCPFNNKYETRLINSKFRDFSAGQIRLSVAPYKNTCVKLWNCMLADTDNDNCISNIDFNRYYLVNEKSMIIPKIPLNIDMTQDGMINEKDDYYFLNCHDLNYGCPGGSACLSEMNYLYYDNPASVFVHEFGHQFANFGDEYNAYSVEPDPSWQNPKSNCYISGVKDTKEECLVHTGCVVKTKQECKTEMDNCVDRIKSDCPEYLECIKKNPANPDVDCNQAENNCYLDCRVKSNRCITACQGDPFCAEKRLTKCENNAQWKQFFGEGCGDASKIDCNEGESRYNEEIGCFEGCGYLYGSFRSTRNTIMRKVGVLPFSFGVWNEKIIHDEIDKFGGESS